MGIVMSEMVFESIAANVVGSHYGQIWYHNNMYANMDN